MQVLLLQSALNFHKSPLRMQLFQAVKIALEGEIIRERATMSCYTYISFVLHILYWLPKLYLTVQ
jgi:hypothetical protein